MSDISSPEMKWLKQALKETWPRRYYYGLNNDKIKPCIKVTNPNNKCSNIIHYKYGNGTLTCYQTSYLIENKKIPSDNIGHCCGNVYNTKYTNCIERSHMIIEKQPDNMHRRSCHSKIRKWEKANRKRLDFVLIGAWTLSDIKIEEQKLINKGLNPTPRLKQKRRNNDINNVNENNNDTSDREMRRKRREERIRNTGNPKEEMDMDSDEEEEEEKQERDNYYQCNCDKPKCFINYHKFKSEYIRKNGHKTIKYFE